MSTAMWGKDIELASQGLFVLRNYNPEGESYDMQKIPTVLMYDNFDHAKELVQNLRNTDVELIEDMRKNAINHITSQNSWDKIAENLFF
jgi:hypothetical protein